MSVYIKEKPEYLNVALSSVWDHQIVKPSQIVIVQDGPLSPGLISSIKKWSVLIGDRFTVVGLPKNLGLARALNIGLAHCRYDLVARMDTDDISLPERFLQQVQFMSNNPSIQILGSAAIEIDQSNIVTGMRVYPELHDKIISNLWACPIIHPSVMFRKPFVEGIGGYNSQLHRRQDYELWFRAYENGALFHNLRNPLIKYRYVEDTHRRQKPQDVLRFSLIGFRCSRRIGLPLWKQIGCFAMFLKSLLPVSLQYRCNLIMRKLDPRRS